MKHHLFFLLFLVVFLPKHIVTGQFHIHLTEEERALMEVPETRGHDAFAMTDLHLPEIPMSFPGETTRVVDPYGSNAPNLLFLSSLPAKPWWDDQSEARLPVLITEPAGLARVGCPVSVVAVFPAGTDPDSIRVVTPYGKEIRSQVRVVNQTAREFEIVFVLDRLNAYQQMPLFIYYGGKPLDRPAVAPVDMALRIEEREDSIVLVNNRLFIELGKNPSSPLNPGLWLDARGHGMEYSLVKITPGVEQAHGIPHDEELLILEDGPVRKTVSYGEWGKGYTVSVYANSPLVYINSASAPLAHGFWFPGGDTLNDVLAYASAEGLKRMPINYTGGNTEPYTYTELKKWFSEGWFALLDGSKGEGLGWFFDLEPARVSIQTVVFGYWLNLSAPGHGALFVARDAKTESCRSAYIAWKCPPLVSIGMHQKFTVIKPERPVFGRDFIRMHLIVERFRPRRDEFSARRYVDEVRAFGGNYLMYVSPWQNMGDGHWGFAYMQPSKGQDGESGPALFDELIRECHGLGMGFCHGLGCGLYTPVLRDMVRRGADAVWLSDEWGWGPCGYYPLNPEQRKRFLEGTWDWSHDRFSEEEQADFKKRYGVDMPGTKKPDADFEDIVDLISTAQPDSALIIPVPKAEKTGFSGLASTNLLDPSQLAMFRMLIDAHNLLMSDLADVAREENSNVFVSATTSPNNLIISVNNAAFHDLESHGDSLTSVVMDLYANDAGWLNSQIKYSRGAQGNRRPLFIIGGYSGFDNAPAVENNLHFQVMFGANGLCYFSLERQNAPWPALGAKEAYELFDYTGFGDFVAKSRPLEFVGILRDRDEFFASLERGETLGHDGFSGSGSMYEHSIFQYIRALDFPIPANIVSAKRLESEIKLPYKVMIVPNNPTISDENVELLAGFVNAGGLLVVECATVQNKAMAELAGVTPVGLPQAGGFKIKGTKAPLLDWSAELHTQWVPCPRQIVTAGAGVEILAEMDGSHPGITMVERGAGKVFFIAPRVGPGARNKQVYPMLRKLVEYAAGGTPVRVLPADAKAWTTILTDGDRYAICAYNFSDEPIYVSLSTAGLGVDLKSLTSIRTGITYPVVNNMAHGLFLHPKKTDYFLSGRVESPPAAIQRARPVSGSMRPGMSFLRLQP